MREVSSTFALSTESSRPPRAAGELERAARDALDLARVVLARVEDGAVVAHAARAVVEAADELAHDQQVDARRRSPGAGSRRRRARSRSPISPASGRTAPPSHFGPPTAPSSTASAARQAASVSAGQRVADRVDRGAAERRAPRPRRRAAARRARARPAAITSGPIPSPGRQTIRLAHRASSRRVRSSTKPVEVGDARRRRAGRRSRACELREHRVLAAGVAQRDPVRAALWSCSRRTISSRRLTAREQLAVERRDLLAQLGDDAVVASRRSLPARSSSASTSGVDLDDPRRAPRASCGVFRPVPVTSTTTRSSLAELAAARRPRGARRSRRRSAPSPKMPPVSASSEMFAPTSSSGTA